MNSRTKHKRKNYRIGDLLKWTGLNDRYEKKESSYGIIVAKNSKGITVFWFSQIKIFIPWVDHTGYLHWVDNVSQQQREKKK